MPFVTFEGIDASGKTTQLTLLAEKLRIAGQKVVCTREAGGTPLGMEIRQLVQVKHNMVIGTLAEALLYAADRAQHLEEVVRPALESQVFVLSDRYVDSSLAFQSVNFDLETVRQINQLATAGLLPELTILCDVDVETSRQRLLLRDTAFDRIESRDWSYHLQVRKVFLQLAKEEPLRFIVVDGKESKETIAEVIWQQVQARFRVGIAG